MNLTQIGAATDATPLPATCAAVWATLHPDTTTAAIESLGEGEKMALVALTDRLAEVNGNIARLAVLIKPYWWY
jgi:hypothetical protein